MANTTIYPYGSGGELPSNIGIVNDLITGGANKALSAEMGKELGSTVGMVGTVDEEITDQYTVSNGQAYGDVGSVISTNTDSTYSKTFIAAGSNLKGQFNTASSGSVSSYIQYVDSSNVITRREYVSGTYENNKTYTIFFDFEPGEAGVYMSGARGSLHVYSYTVVDFSLSDLTVVDNATSVFDAIEKLGTVTKEEGTRYMTVEEAMQTYENTSLRNRFIYGTAGGAIQYTAQNNQNNVRNATIPLDGVASVDYPAFMTSSGYGSLIVDSSSLVVEALVNTTEPSGTIITKDTSAYSTGGYKIIVSIFPYSTSGDLLIKLTYTDSVSRTARLNEYVAGLVVNDLSNKSADTVLSTIGLANLLSGKGGGISFPFKDFGTMPSCLSTDSNAFLADGVDGEGEALIQYSDVVAKYDALVTAYPTYVTKTALGYDASGTIMIYSYTFTPKYWKQSVYLQAGVHGWEPDPVFALAEIMYLISNAYGNVAGAPYVADNDILTYLRGNVKFTIVPCVNPWGFNDRGSCVYSAARRGQNNYNNVQLNGNWGAATPEPECAYVKTILTSLKDELSFTIDMHSTVHSDTRTRYGCFYGGYNADALNVLTIMRTCEWLYRYYDVQYPSIVNGDSAPNPFDSTYASIGKMTNVFSSWCLATFNVQSSTMEFSDHVWTPDLHTSVAMSVAVNMYLNQIVQQVCAEFVVGGVKALPASDVYQAKG